jgi:hypothetical protein
VSDNEQAPVTLDLGALLGGGAFPPSPFFAPDWDKKLKGKGWFEDGHGTKVYVYDFAFSNEEGVAPDGEVRVNMLGDHVKLDLLFVPGPCDNEGCNLTHGFTVEPRDAIGLLAWAIVKHLPYGRLRTNNYADVMGALLAAMMVEGTGSKRGPHDSLSPLVDTKLPAEGFGVEIEAKG